jgi:hypothetical protein
LSLLGGVNFPAARGQTALALRKPASPGVRRFSPRRYLRQSPTLTISAIGSTYAFRVADNSMEDLIATGDLIGVDGSERDPEAILNAKLPLALVWHEESQRLLVRQARKTEGYTLFEPRKPGAGNPAVIFGPKMGHANPVRGKVVWIHHIVK